MKKCFILVTCFLLSIRIYGQEPDSTKSETEMADWVTNVPTVPIIDPFSIKTHSPYSYSLRSESDINSLSWGQEPSFVLSSLPSMTVYSDAGSYNGYSYYRLRGIDQTRINVTLDGFPLNEPEDQGVYFSNYPDIMNSLSMLQVIRGVGLTKNGAAGYAGSMELSSPILSDSTRREFGVNYGSFGSHREYAEWNKGMKNGLGLYVRGSNLYSNGYKYHSKNASQSLFLAGEKKGVNSSLKLITFAGHQQNQMAWLGVSDSLIDIDPRTNANNSNEDDEFTQVFAGLKHKLILPAKNHQALLHSGIFYNYLNGNYDFDLNNFLGFPSTSEMFNYAFRSHFMGGYTNYTRQFNASKLVIGINAQAYQRAHTGSEASLGQLYTNTGFRNMGSAFARYEKIMRSFEASLEGQLRYSEFSYTGSVKMDKMSWLFFNPKASLSYFINSGNSFYLSAGRTSREPTRNDIFGGWDDLAADSLGNPVLGITQAESVTDIELGFRKFTSRASYRLNLFYMDFQNEIVLNGQFGPNGLALTNSVDNSFRTGIEADIDIKLHKNLSYHISASGIWARITQNDTSFSPILTPNAIIDQGLTFKHGKWSLMVNPRYQSASWIDFANENKVDGYLLLNARAAFTLKHWEFSIFGNNLLNSRYYNNGYVDWDGTPKYFIQAPANFLGAVKWTF